jgi:hypothetical protein
MGWWFGGIGGFVAEEEVTAYATACFAFGEVGGVAVDVHDHAAGEVAYDCIRMGSSIVQQVSESFSGCLGALGLGSCECSKGNKHGGVNGTGVV